MQISQLRTSTYPALEVVDLIIRDSVSLSNYGDQVDLGVKLLHDFNIEGLERVTGGLDEVDNCVNAVVDDVHAVDLVLGIEVSVKSLLNVLNNRVPRFVVIDEVTESRCVNDSQSQANAVLLDIGADRLYRNGLGDVDAGGLRSLGGYSEVLNSVFTRVDFPRPDSPIVL